MSTSRRFGPMTQGYHDTNFPPKFTYNEVIEQLETQSFGGLTLDEVIKILKEVHPERFI